MNIFFKIIAFAFLPVLILGNIGTIIGNEGLYTVER